MQEARGQGASALLRTNKVLHRSVGPLASASELRPVLLPTPSAISVRLRSVGARHYLGGVNVSPSVSFEDPGLLSSLRLDFFVIVLGGA